MTYEEILIEAKSLLKSAGIESNVHEAEYIICEVLKVDRTSLYLDYKEEVPLDSMLRILDVIDIRTTERRPLQYIFGHTNFYGRFFKVDENVLIPRPETEILVEESLKVLGNIHNPKVLEIGVGSGAVSVTIALEKIDCRILAVDISEEAMSVAKQNIDRYNIKNIELKKSDVFESVEGTFNLIVSNPPYLSEVEYKEVDKELMYEPKKALVGEDEGYEIYRKICDRASELLLPNGYLILEIGSTQYSKVEGMLKETFSSIDLVKDNSDLDRVIVAKK